MYIMLGACGNRAKTAAKEYAERYVIYYLPNANVFY
jgi:hypothetical protein